MAIGRLSVKVGKVGKAGPHAAYIAREAQYASRLDHGERLIAKVTGNMPAWAQHDSQVFWAAADSFERKNGTTYREMEIALPRELTDQQQIELVNQWVEHELGNFHAFQWAIHSPPAADGNEQPHVHLMFSERTLDGIERDPEQYFKRYNSKNPENGGAKKANTGKDAATRRQELKDLRHRWELMCNDHLQAADQSERIDMRSHADRGTGEVPERKMLPSEWRQPEVRGKIIDFRQAKAQLQQAAAQVRALVPDVGAAIIDLAQRKQEREAQAAKRDEAQAKLERWAEGQLPRERKLLGNNALPSEVLDRADAWTGRQPIPTPTMLKVGHDLAKATGDLSKLQKQIGFKKSDIERAIRQNNIGPIGGALAKVVPMPGTGPLRLERKRLRELQEKEQWLKDRIKAIKTKDRELQLKAQKNWDLNLKSRQALADLLRRELLPEARQNLEQLEQQEVAEARREREWFESLSRPDQIKELQLQIDRLPGRAGGAAGYKDDQARRELIEQLEQLQAAERSQMRSEGRLSDPDTKYPRGTKSGPSAQLGSGST